MKCTACHVNEAVEGLCEPCNTLASKLEVHEHDTVTVKTVPVFVGGVLVGRRCTGCRGHLSAIFRPGIRISLDDLKR